jgi:hypothetical protein
MFFFFFFFASRNLCTGKYRMANRDTAKIKIKDDSLKNGDGLSQSVHSTQQPPDPRQAQETRKVKDNLHDYGGKLRDICKYYADRKERKLMFGFVFEFFFFFC